MSRIEYDKGKSREISILRRQLVARDEKIERQEGRINYLTRLLKEAGIEA